MDCHVAGESIGAQGAQRRSRLRSRRPELDPDSLTVAHTLRHSAVLYCAASGADGLDNVKTAVGPEPGARLARLPRAERKNA